MPNVKTVIEDKFICPSLDQGSVLLFSRDELQYLMELRKKMIMPVSTVLKSASAE
jgi:hypothetical protein